MNSVRKITTTLVRNAWWLSLIVFAQSVQLLAVFVWVSARVPVVSALRDAVYPEWLFFVRPEREILLFRLFVLFAVVMQAAAFAYCFRKLDDDNFTRALKPFAWTEILLVALLLAAAFKTVVYPQRAQLAMMCFYTVAVMLMLNKIFFRKFYNTACEVVRFIFSEHNADAFRTIFCALFIVFIIALIYIPNPESALARMFMGDQFHHYDSFIMAPGWAHLSGQRLNMDILSQYGVGMPVVLSRLSQVFGPFSYLSVLKLLVWATIIYFIFTFVLLRVWLKSVVLAMCGVLIGIKWIMFHQGIFPFAFTLPSATIVRYGFDIFFFMIIHRHLQTHNRSVLLAGGALCGLSIFYMTSTGMCLAVAYYAYLCAHLITPHIRKYIFAGKKDIAYLSALLAMVPGVAILCFWIVVGQDLWTKEFSYNMKEFNLYFLNGFGTMPMYESLQNKNYLAGIIGLWIPLVYMFTVSSVAGLIYLRRIDYRHLFVVIVSLYGLGMYHYYVARSAVTSYYVVAIPYVLVGCFWLRVIVELLESRIKQRVQIALLLIALYALLTTHNFVSYPNVLNVSKNPIVDPRMVQPLDTGGSYFGHLYRKASRLPAQWFRNRDEELKVESDFGSDDELAAFYQKRFDFKADAALIGQLTDPQEPVALISSFEVKILMQANRKPYFYYFPLIVSRPMKMHMFSTSTLYTTDHFARIIRQLEEHPPEYIFIEKTFYYAKLLPKIDRPVDGFMPLMYYVLNFYEPHSENGGYLLALKRLAKPDEQREAIQKSIQEPIS